MSKTTTTSTASVELDDLAPHIELLRTVEDQLARLKNRLGENETGTVNGVPVVTYRSTLRITLSQRLVKELHPEVARQCGEITEVRTFLLVDVA